VKVKVVLSPSGEGYAVSASGLPGRWSQGATQEEALEQMADAIRDYLDAGVEQPDGVEVPEIELPVSLGGVTNDNGQHG